MVATAEFIPVVVTTLTFQSPFRRGNGCYRLYLRSHRLNFRSFSPLFVGAMVATEPKKYFNKRAELLSVPFSSGQWLLRQKWVIEEIAIVFFQSPFRRGNGCYDAKHFGFVFFRPVFQSPFRRGNGCYIPAYECLEIV